MKNMAMKVHWGPFSRNDAILRLPKNLYSEYGHSRPELIKRRSIFAR